MTSDKRQESVNPDSNAPRGELVDELREVGPLMARLDSADQAAPATSFAQNLRRRLLAKHDEEQNVRANGHVRTVMAQLASTVSPAHALAGTRGGALRLARYEAEELTIVLKIEGSRRGGDAQVTVYGALDSADLDDRALSAATARLEGTQIQSNCLVDDLGNFVLTEIPTGIYRLTIQLPDHRAVMIENLSLTI